MKNFVRSLSAAVVAGALLFGSTVSALAAVAESTSPLPSSGPTTGGTVVSVPVPVGVTFVSVATGEKHSLAIGSDGNAYAWGGNSEGQLGIGTKTAAELMPVRVQKPVGVRFTSVAAGDNHSLALGSDGKVYAWGMNNDGQLGDGTRITRAVPVVVQVPGSGATFSNVVAGAAHSLVISSDGITYAWGDNSHGQLGVGDRFFKPLPTPVQSADVAFTQISAGARHTLALGTDGRSYAWGDNSHGQLGDGIRRMARIPTLVKQPTDVQFLSVAAGCDFSLATGSDGHAYAWGANSVGQLGDGTGYGRELPVQVRLPSEVRLLDINAGAFHSIATDIDGVAYAWGANWFGQLGDETTLNRHQPVRVHLPAGVVLASVSAGSYHSMATTGYGGSLAWGLNSSGQLGDGDDENILVPSAVRPLQPVVLRNVLFGGKLGTGLVKNTDGTWSVTTPAHAAGAVDVVVSWTLGGATQTPVRYANAFTYEEVPTVPTITDPGDEMVLEGGSAVFTVGVSGFPEPTVSWEVSSDVGDSWAAIGSDSAAVVSSDGLTVTVAGQLDHDGYLYRAVATNSEGTATSDPALLRVSQAPVAPTITNPESRSVVEGEGAVFEVYATGFPEPAVDWEVSRAGGSWEPIGTDDAATVTNDGLTLTIASTLTHDGYQYRAVAVNSEGEAVSDPASLSVAPYVEAPTITTPDSQGVFEHDDAVFTVTTTGVPVPEVGWEVSPDQGVTWNPISTDSAATLTDENRTLTIATTIAHDGYQYRATAVNSVGEAVSEPATLSVWRAPVAPTVTNPTDQTVTEGQDASFTVVTTGLPEPVMIWEVSRDGGTSWDAISADTSATLLGNDRTLRIAAVLSHDGYLYRATAVNEAGRAQSDYAKLTVKSKSDGGVPDGSTPSDDSSLPTTGGESSLPLYSGAAGVLLLSAAVLGIARLRRQRSVQ